MVECLEDLTHFRANFNSRFAATDIKAFLFEAQKGCFVVEVVVANFLVWQS